MTGVVDSLSGAIEREFDGLDRLTRERSPQGQIDYGYYANGWRQTMTDRDPNGERWREPGGTYVDWHRGRPRLPGWRGKDHWHHNGGEEHLRGSRRNSGSADPR
jgi:hypothetical protein